MVYKVLIIKLDYNKANKAETEKMKIKRMIKTKNLASDEDENGKHCNSSKNRETSKTTQERKTKEDSTGK